MRPPARYRKRIVFLILVFAASMGAHAHFQRRPLLLLALGYPELHVFRPLKHVAAYPQTREQWEAYSTRNWNGRTLFISGGWPWEDQAWAPPGSIAIAALPRGIGIAWGRQDQTLSGPHTLPYLLVAPLLAAALFSGTAFRWARGHERRAAGLCPRCGYRLTANTSGVCPECGSSVRRERHAGSDEHDAGDSREQHQSERHLMSRRETKYWTYDEAVARARAEATRDLSEADSVITYVTYFPGSSDFYRGEFRFEEPHGWVQSYRRLLPDERLPDEQITDARIREIAQRGQVITAIGLYRTRYDVGLAEGQAGVERLLRKT